MPDWELIDHDPARGVRKYLAAGSDPDSIRSPRLRQSAV